MWITPIDEQELQQAAHALRGANLEHIAKKLEDALSRERDPRRPAIIQLARERYGREGEIEIDDTADLSLCEDVTACWVSAWLWIRLTQAEAPAASLEADRLPEEAGAP